MTEFNPSFGLGLAYYGIKSDPARFLFIMGGILFLFGFIQTLFNFFGVAYFLTGLSGVSLLSGVFLKIKEEK